MIGRDDFHEYVNHYENVDNVHNDVVDDHDDDAMEFHDDIGDHIGVQNVTNIVPTYEVHAPSFHANTWDNVVDPSNIEILFASSWVRGMNFSKGLIFPNEEAVKQALIVYSMENNRSYTTEWSNQKRLCVECVNGSCAWKVRAFPQRKLNKLWAITVYNGPHTCPSVRVNKDGRMIKKVNKSPNTIMQKFLPGLQGSKVTQIDDSLVTSKRYDQWAQDLSSCCKKLCHIN